MNISYTLCFIRKKTLQSDQILMLYRNKNPNKDKWNGVGGKIEKGESPYESCLREIGEETGLIIRNLKEREVVTWNNEGGLYVFTAEYDEGLFINCDEGELDWKEYQWVKQSNDVVSNIPYFLDEIFSELNPMEHSFQYDDKGEITSYHRKSINHQLGVEKCLI
ncbi:8-oxo-dGTP diphosphatase [Bacillus sp. 31A1R]|uniref:8-oxo-dGTP diphosphatase n=1 Tax=Robertmurraya mangrovi TaxID=3098077 RepID=A0ABU5J045_9BACI|nr:8-oxo-dGTP diphosphatase [Bacillus sp. 31A1R]MDZ5472741.1 8-oxo-dGTP diphosphatase [Bacillus sp. 31A1R]